MQSKKDTNLYLFYEFAVEGDEEQVSEVWPFELRKVGRIRAGVYESDVYEFSDGDETYFAFDLQGLVFYPAEGLTVEQLELEQRGSLWLGQHEPIDLNTAKIGDESVPGTPERKAAILELASRLLPTSVENIGVLEGLFLKQERSYLALVQRMDSGEVYVVGSHIAPR